MKAAGIIRIIVGLVIAVLLTAILVVLLTGNNIFARLGWNNGWIDGAQLEALAQPLAKNGYGQYLLRLNARGYVP